MKNQAIQYFALDVYQASDRPDPRGRHTRAVGPRSTPASCRADRVWLDQIGTRLMLRIKAHVRPRRRLPHRRCGGLGHRPDARIHCWYLV